jgi:hypothetical protein
MSWLHTVSAGKPVNTLYVAKKMKLAREMYFAILLDRTTSGPIMIGCSEGGTSIEDLAEKFPEKIIKVPVNIQEGITDSQAKTMAEGLGVKQHMDDAIKQIKALYTLFVEKDCTMVEVWDGTWYPAELQHANLSCSTKPERLPGLRRVHAACNEHGLRAAHCANVRDQCVINACAAGTRVAPSVSTQREHPMWLPA